MDCLRIVSVALGLMTCLSGCKTTTLTGPTMPGPMTQSTATPVIPPGAVIKPKEHPPKASLLVAAGQLLANEAAADPSDPSRQMQLRQQAYGKYLDAIKLDSRYVPAYQELAHLQLALDNQTEARQTYQKALKIVPRNAALWYELGICHNYDQNWKDALHCLHEAARLDPQQRQYTNALAVVLARMGKVDESLAQFQRCTTEGESHYRLARTLQYLNQPELSREQLLLALAKDPQLVSAQSMLAEMNAPLVAPGASLPAAPQQTAAALCQGWPASPIQQASFSVPAPEPQQPADKTAPAPPSSISTTTPAKKAKKPLVVPPMPHI
jgi:tetratricopeptide (TPR) repeat protein